MDNYNDTDVISEDDDMKPPKAVHNDIFRVGDAKVSSTIILGMEKSTGGVTAIESINENPKDTILSKKTSITKELESDSNTDTSITEKLIKSSEDAVLTESNKEDNGGKTVNVFVIILAIVAGILSFLGVSYFMQ